MPHFYLLNVVLNLLGGAVIFRDSLAERFPALSSLRELLGSRQVRGTIGVGSAIVGLIKLIWPSLGNATLFAGDLLPAVAGIGVGATILTELFAEKTAMQTEETQTETIPARRNILTSLKKPIGIVALASAILHFLFPAAVIL
jgi:hypothetical protein